MGLFSKNQPEKQRGKTVAESKLEKIIARKFSGDLRELPPSYEGGSYSWATVHESTMVIAEISDEFGTENYPVVRVYSYCVYGARDDDKLFRYLMADCTTSIFSQFKIEKGEKNGTVDVLVQRYLALDTLDDDEFETAFLEVATTSNDNDDEIVKRFGGSTAWEE